MSVRREGPQGDQHGLGHRGRVELDAGVPFAGPQEVGDLRIRAPGDELADRVAAIQEPPVLAVDETDRALGPDDALEPG